MSEIPIRVNNLGVDRGYMASLKSILNSNRILLEKILVEYFEEPIDTYLVNDLKQFVDREFMDIEKLRIFANYLILEEPPFIHGIAILDKIIIGGGENLEGTFLHTFLHATLHVTSEPYHYVDNYMELKFHREAIVDRLIRKFERDEVADRIKQVEMIYLYFLSALKHYSLYIFAKREELHRIIELDLGGYNSWISRLKSLGSERVTFEEKVNLTSNLTVLELLGFEINQPGDLYIDEVGKIVKELVMSKPRLRSYREPNLALTKAIDLVLNLKNKP